MNNVPAGIEASLLDAGFTSTEVVIIRRLILDDALTLRELAMRTGKSTGVLDQAVKKLVQKNIVRKEMINDSFKFTLISMHTVLHWMEDDSKRKRELMTRRQQNFESFIRTLEESKKRPDMEFFDGIEGFAQAYRKLLDCGSEMLAYVPVFCAIEDHPLRDFLVEWFRNRRKKGIFSRVIAHNTPLGRRYQSRDPFEYRESVLVDEKEMPFTFEKIICGDTVACFNYPEKRACLLRYPEMAAMERSLFESHWRQITKKNTASTIPVQTAAEAKGSVVASVQPLVTVSLRIRALSGLREFFVSKKSVAVFCGIALLSAGLTFYLYSYTEHLQFTRMQDTIQSIASTGAFEFDAKDLDILQDKKDWKRPELVKVGNILEKIRKNNEDIEFVYIIRKTKNDPTKMEFVVDADSINPYANIDNDPTNDVDMNGDGKIDSADEQTGPGHPYPTAPLDSFIAYNGPTATKAFYEDQWGKSISGYAPIKDANGRVAGVLAVDMRAKLLTDRTHEVFQPILYFLGFFFFFVLIRLAAFNKSLFNELWKTLNMRKVLVTALLCAEIAYAITFGLYQYMLRQTINEMGIKLMSIVSTAAPDFNASDLDKLHWAKDMKTETYQKIFRKLNEVKDANSDITYIYIERLAEKPNIWEFVADSYSNYDLPTVGPDENKDGVLDGADTNVSPGVIYWDENPQEVLTGLDHPSYEKQLYTTQWGTLISGYAPIKDGHGKSHAILGADADVAIVLEAVHKKFAVWLWFTGAMCITLFLVWARKLF